MRSVWATTEASKTRAFNEAWRAAAPAPSRLLTPTTCSTAERLSAGTGPLEVSVGLGAGVAVGTTLVATLPPPPARPGAGLARTKPAAAGAAAARLTPAVYPMVPPARIPIASPSPPRTAAFDVATPRIRRVPQLGQRRVPSTSGRAHDGQSKTVWLISPIAMDSVTGAASGGGSNVRRRFRRATFTVIACGVSLTARGSGRGRWLPPNAVSTREGPHAPSRWSRRPRYVRTGAPSTGSRRPRLDASAVGCIELG